MTYKKGQRFGDSGDRPDFRIEDSDDEEPDPTAIAYDAGKMAFAMGTRRSDNPEDDVLLRKHWSNGWDMAKLAASIS